jgi:general secretion pathway protein C
MFGVRLAAFMKEHGWVLNLIFIALGAYFVAGAANAVVARSIRVVPSLDDLPTRAAPPSPLRRQGNASFQAIAERNLIGAKREVIDPQALATAAPSMVSGRNYRETELKPCTVAAVLRATLVAESAPEWSVAVIVDNASRETHVYSINDGSNAITDDAVVVDVRSCEVVVRRRDHFELCACESEGTPAPALAARSFTNEAIEGGGVTKVSETQYTVARAEVDGALSNLSQVATQARIVPSFKDGKPNGFKLFSIKPGSIYSKIGLQNGDVIQKINGYEMNSPDKALEIYQKLKDSTSVSIELQRRGQNMHFSYAIQ